MISKMTLSPRAASRFAQSEYVVALLLAYVHSVMVLFALIGPGKVHVLKLTA